MQRFACLSIDAISLQLSVRNNPDWLRRSVVVVDRDSPRGVVLFANERARSSGILPGMRYAAGLSLDADLRAAVHAPSEITRELGTLVTSLQRFTPTVEPSPDEPGVFWLDASGMLRLYPSLDAWAQAVRGAMREHGLSAAITVGFSRFGTYATVRALVGKGQRAWASAEEEAKAAARVPLHRIGIEPKIREALTQLGVHTVGQLATLPEAGLLRRFGRDVQRLHQLARGAREEPITPAPTETPLQACIDFDDPVDDREALLFFGKQLLDPLLVRLHKRGEALAELSLTMKSTPPVTTALRPAVPTLELAQLLNLLRLRLELVELPTGANAVVLEVKGHPATREQLALFAEQRKKRDLAAGDRALARVRAALGDDAVVRARLRSGHLPEGGFVWEPIQHLVDPQPTAVLLRPLVRRLRAKPLPLPQRPSREPDGWLLRGTAHGRVEKLMGPFCISGGWWRTEQRRDYYYAELSRGAIYWIYYDRQRRRWFLQGEVG